MNKIYLEKIKKCVLRLMAGEDVSIALFGSASSGNDTSSSDVDIAVIPKGKWNSGKLSLLREELEEFNIPYTVDLVDFSTVSKIFRETALANALWWKE